MFFVVGSVQAAALCKQPVIFQFLRMGFFAAASARSCPARLRVNFRYAADDKWNMNGGHACACVRPGSSSKTMPFIFMHDRPINSHTDKSLAIITHAAGGRSVATKP